MAIPATRLTLDAVTPRRRGLMLPTLALVAVCYLGFANGSRHSYKNDIRSDHTEEAVVDSNIEENDHTRVALVGPCVNLRRECARYAAAGRCSQDPRWMHPHCPVACGVCHLRIQSVPRHRQFGHYNLVYSGTVYDAIRDEILGVPQRLEPGQETAIRERVDNAIEYMKGVVMEDDRYRPVREICRTSHVDCAHWAILGECENNEEDMLKHCAPVCFVCEQLHMEAKCPIDPNEKHGACKWSTIIQRQVLVRCQWYNVGQPRSTFTA